MSLRILKNAGLLSVARFSGDALNFLLFVILSRQLGPDGIGQYAFGMAIALLAYSCVNFGLDDLSIRECAQLEPRERATLIGHLNGLQLAFILVLLAAFGGIILAGHQPGPRMQIAAILSGYYIALAVARILFTPAFSQQRMFAQAIAEFSCRAIMIISAICLIWFWHAPLNMALLPYPLGGLVLVVIAARSAWRYNHELRLKFDWRRIIETAKTALPFGAAALIFALQMRINYVALGTMKGAGATGIYASAVKFLETGILPLTYLALSAYPSLSRAVVRDSAALKHVGDRLFRVSLVGGALLAWFLVMILPMVIVPILGTSFASAKQLFPAVGVLAILMSLDLPADRMLLAAKLQTLRVKFTIAGVATNLVLAVTLIPFFGVAGALAATLAGQAVVLLLSLIALSARHINSIAWKTGAQHCLALGAAVTTGMLAHAFTNEAIWSAIGSLASMCLVWLATGFLSLKQIIGNPIEAAAPARVE